MVSYIFILTQDLNNLIVDVLQSQFKFRSKVEIFNLTATVTIKPPFKNRELEHDIRSNETEHNKFQS